MRKRKLWIIPALVLAACMIAGACIGLHLYREHMLDEYQSEALQELRERRGEYDERSIVLYDTTPTEARALAARLGAELRLAGDGRFATLTLPAGRSIEDVYAARENRDCIRGMAADYRVKASELTAEEAGGLRVPARPQYAVEDSDYALQTYLDYLNMGETWRLTQGGSSTVAVIDTGIDTDHPEFAGRISEYSYNATEDKIVKDQVAGDGSLDWSLIEDAVGHGTAVTGVIAAAMDGRGTVGMLPKVEILVIKAECDENGNFLRTSDLVFGLYYAIERDVDVVNMSFGSTDPYSFASATRLAHDSDVVCVAAAGNESTAALTYPAADEYVIGVGALEADGWALATYSNYGENVDLVAPGTVYTTLPGGEFGMRSGTSFSAPIVAGVVALYSYADHHRTDGTSLAEMLCASAYDLGDPGPDWYFGYGALDVAAFVYEDVGTVTFDMMTDELEDMDRVFIRNHTLQYIPAPERLYAVFDGWYYDPQYTEEYEPYADVLTADLTLYAKWVGEDDGVPYTYRELDDGTVEILSYTGRRRYITVPDSIDGKMVTSIGAGAFAGETSLREVILPQGLRYIRDRAFAGCHHLLHIHVPDTVVHIGESAFLDNVRLSYVALGQGSRLSYVGELAFAGCVQLQRFELPATTTKLDGSAFFGATGLTAFTVQAGNTAFTAKDGVLLNATGSTLVCYPAGRRGTYTLPATVRTVGDYAFAYARLGELSLVGVQRIGQKAFTLSSLTQVTIPDTVTHMGQYAFAYAENLSSVTLGEGLAELPLKAFSGCSRLADLAIPATVRSIGEAAFSGTSSLTGVRFAEDGELMQIGPAAFSCSGLRSLHLPASVMTLGNHAFASTPLASVTFAEGSRLRTVGVSAFAWDARLTEISLPQGLEEIGGFAFCGTGLRTVTIPAAVTHLGEGAFAACHALTEILVEDENRTYADVDGVVYDKPQTTLIAYPAGNDRSDYEVVETATVIGESAFYGSAYLMHVYHPDTLAEIRAYAFYECVGLTSMEIPDSVVQIGRQAFAHCRALSFIWFGENSRLPRIGYEAFAYSGLYEFRVPAGVSTMAQRVFFDCDQLIGITFAENSRIESIAAYTFDGCDRLESITFEPGSALTSIQAHGFEGLKALVSLDLGDAKLTNIDNYAFRFCESLTEFRVPAGVTTLGRYAFYSCLQLREIYLPASIEEIGRFAFLGTDSATVYFEAGILPALLEEDWDHGLDGYHLGVTEVSVVGDWQYATLSDGSIALLGYSGTDKELDLSSLDFGGPIITIGGDAFAFSPVERITLPDTLITIQAGAFDHASLRAIHIPASVRFIGRAAFSATPIEELTFAEGSALTVIERSAFEGTRSLSSVTLPANLTTLGRAAFKSSGLAQLTFAEGIALTEIPEEAFARTRIESLSLPDTVTVVGDGAFREIGQLKTVDFGHAPELMIRSNAFYASGLESLHIPAHVTSIGEYAFVALANLERLTVDEANPYYKEIDGVLVTKDGRKLVVAPAGRTGSFTVPAGIEVIGFGAFEGSRMESITFLPDANILSFGYRAFFGSAIREMHVPAHVVAIDYYAFGMCEQLTKVTFAEGNQLRGVYEGAFYGCMKLKDITLPDTVREISDFAFYGCRQLDYLPVSEGNTLQGVYGHAFAYTGLSGELTLPEAWVDVGDYAFRGNRLTSVTIPATSARELIIGIGVFEDCRDMESITLPFVGASFEDPDITWLGYIFGAGGYEASAAYVPASLKHVTLTEGLSVIGAHAFDGLACLETLDIPASVTIIEGYAFQDTTAVYELQSPVTVRYTDWSGHALYKTVPGHFGAGLSGHLTLAEGVTAIGDSSFRYCRHLTGLTLPDSVTTIGGHAFSESGLESIELPAHMESLKDRVFEGCKQLTHVVLPRKLTGVPYGTFTECTALESVVLPADLTEIDTSAFEGCVRLSEITLPDGVVRIGEAAFEGCTSLSEITLPDGVVRIGEAAFKGCEGLQSVALPASLTTLETSAFEGCVSLESILLPGSLESWGEETFAGCTSLAQITVSEGITAIPARSFYGCRSLISVTLPDSLAEIGASAFASCRYLMRLTLPAGLRSIEEYAFGSCDSLYYILNRSDLAPVPGSNDYGLVAKEAFMVEDRYGNCTWRNDSADVLYVRTEDGFLFELTELWGYQLIAYLGEEDTVTLPTDIMGNPYRLYSVRGIRHVIFPEEMTTIDSYAFLDCDELESVTLPAAVTSIGSNAFSGCSSLAHIHLPDSLTEIGYAAFRDCTSLTNVQIPADVTSIGASTFEGCTGLACIDIPDSVMSIGDSAFYGCSSLAYVDLPDSLTEIEYAAFRDCTSLTDVQIPVGVTSIGSNAFSGCSSLARIHLPDGLTKIGGSAFRECTSLTDVQIPAGVTSIGASTFEGCTGLVSIDIPDSVTSIGDYAFEGCTGLVSIDIPDSVTSIGAYAFDGCTGLEAIYISEHVEFIGTGAFRGCGLATLTIDEGNPLYAVRDGIVYDREMTEIIMILDGVTDVCVPSSVTSIDGAFEGNTTIRSITFEPGSRVTEFRDNEFFRCSGLESITVPAGLTDIGSRVFADCPSLQDIYVTDLEAWMQVSFESYSEYPLATLHLMDEHGAEITEVTIPEGTTELRPYLLANCHALTHVTLPESLERIGTAAFKYCDGLTELHIPDGVKILGDAAFADCTGLTEITVPESVTSPGQSVFADCSSLVRATLPVHWTEIPSDIFFGCSALAEVNIPSGVERIGDRAFSECASLTEIVLPEGLKEIGWGAFQRCSALTQIRIPAGVTVIGSNAFADCDALTEISIPAGVTEIGSETFRGCHSLVRVTLPEGLTKIGYSAFEGCLRLESLVLPASVTSIENEAFLDCAALRDVHIPEGVTEIGYDAFRGCTRLAHVAIPAGVTEIPYGAFMGCSSLADVTLSEGLTVIGKYAFSSCYRLGSITLPESLTSLEYGAFAGCTGITEIRIPAGVTLIDPTAFSGCLHLNVVHNDSDLEIPFGNLVIDKEGNETCRDPEALFEVVDTEDGFRFLKQNGTYTLILYMGSEDTVTLPADIEGHPYTVYSLQGVRNVILPSWMTRIDDYAFHQCYTLESITIPEGVTSIGEYAFYRCLALARVEIPSSVESIGYNAFSNCRALTEIRFSEGLRSIGEVAFSGCYALTSVALPESVTTIGDSAFAYCRGLESIRLPEHEIEIGKSVFQETAYYLDESNWDGGTLYVGRHLIKLDEDTVYMQLKEGTCSMAADALDRCYRLKWVTPVGKAVPDLTGLTNLETLVITDLPDYFLEYFDNRLQNIPLTLKNVVLVEGVRMSPNALYRIGELPAGITVYVGAEEGDVRWDENFPGWSGECEVLYGDRWITAEFYDENGVLLACELFETAQVIRRPHLELLDSPQYTYTLVGWDTDGDGVADTLPATSTVDILARPVLEREIRQYTVRFFGTDADEPTATLTLPYGSTLILPADPEREGYGFLGWRGYTEGMIVTEDISLYAAWAHVGDGHTYADPVWVEPTCEEPGYNRHTCTLCGEWYATDTLPATGHSFDVSTVAPTCTEAGYTLTVCACGHTEQSDITDAVGHRFGAWVTDTSPACETAGEQSRTCEVCAFEERETLPAIGHDFSVEVIRQATCTEEGEQLYTCTACGDKRTEVLPTAAHSDRRIDTTETYVLWLAGKLPQLLYAYDGSVHYCYTCTDCHRILTVGETSTGPSASTEGCEHSLGDWQALEEACGRALTEVRSCTLCGQLILARTTGKIKEHSLGALVEALSPDCEHEGSVAYYECSDCHRRFDADMVELTDIVLPATGHAFGPFVSQKPTCTEDGVLAHRTCTACGKHFDAAGEEMSNVTDPARGHAYVLVKEVPATCVTEGYSKYLCSVCGESHTDDYVEPTGHTYDGDSDAECNVCRARRPVATAAPDDGNAGGCQSAVTCGWLTLLQLGLGLTALRKRKE